MAVKTKDEIITSLNAFIGEDASDDALAILEDVADTYDDFSKRISESGDYKEKYETLDAEWRQKYKERFMNGSTEDDDKLFKDEPPEKEEKRTFEDLFTTK